MITSLIVLDPDNRMTFQAFNDHPFAKLSPDEYKSYITECENKAQLQLKKGAGEPQSKSEEIQRISTSHSGDQPTLEDLKECLQDIKTVISVTLSRANALIKIYKNEVEERQAVSPFPEERELKLVMFGIAREIRQIVIEFLKPDFV